MNEITITTGSMKYIVNLATNEVWVLKGGGARAHRAPREYRSTITSERKIKKMIKLAQAQVAATAEKSDPKAFKVGDRVYIKMANGRPGDNLYEIASLQEFPPCRCTIRTPGLAPNGKPYAAQEWDTSMLFKAGPELLAKLLPRVG